MLQDTCVVEVFMFDLLPVGLGTAMNAIFPILGLGILKGLFLAELLKGSKRSKSHGYEYPQPPLYHQQPQYSYGHQSYDQGYPQPQLYPHAHSNLL